jgi:hypothetical protein
MKNKKEAEANKFILEDLKSALASIENRTFGEESEEEFIKTW